MQEPGCKENYPIAIVIGSNLLSLLIYVIGAIILFQFSIIWVICYVIFILFLEFRLLGGHCVDCYYYGKTCAFGKGRLSSLFFRRGSPEKLRPDETDMERYCPGFSGVHGPRSRRNTAPGTGIYLDHPYSHHRSPRPGFSG